MVIGAVGARTGVGEKGRRRRRRRRRRRKGLFKADAVNEEEENERDRSNGERLATGLGKGRRAGGRSILVCTSRHPRNIFRPTHIPKNAPRVALLQALCSDITASSHIPPSSFHSPSLSWRPPAPLRLRLCGASAARSWLFVRATTALCCRSPL